MAGVGDGLTAGLLRHSQRKRGATARPGLRGTAPALDPTIYGVPLRDIPDPPGTSKTIIAYEKDVPTKGGYVVMANGMTLRQMTAAEFQSAPKAKARKNDAAKGN